jgi:outer membrane protein OmpA-like peptidoglycan-associated protein
VKEGTLVKQGIGLSLFLLLGAVCGLSGCAMLGDHEKITPAKVLMAAPETRMVPNSTLPFCSDNEIYMVMPEEGGKAGTVAVSFGSGEQTVLHGDYSAMSVSAAGRKTYIADAQQMQALFSDSIKMLPAKPLYVLLYFLPGTDKLTPASNTASAKIFGEIAKRKTSEVILVGHTDTVGSDAYNLKLSLERAKAVQHALIALGVPASVISVSGRGERELLVKTADNVSEPENRRVELNVR